MRITSVLAILSDTQDLYRCVLVIGRRLTIGLLKSIGILLFLCCLECVDSNLVQAVQVVRDGETVSVSDLHSPAGSGDQSTQVYPGKRSSANNRSDGKNPGHAVLAVSNDMSDFVDPPTDYEATSSNKLDNDSALASKPELMDASVPLEQIPLDKINQNSVPISADRNNPQWELIRQVGTLQQEVSELRGKLEQQAQQISVMESQQKQRYLDLDSRLEALQGSISIPPSNAQPDVNSRSDDTNKDDSISDGASSSPQPTPKSVGTINSVKMLEDYEAAQLLLKNKKLKSAKAAFTQFTQNYPDENLTGDAHYWLGEIYLAGQPAQEESAKGQFTQVVNEFADSKKVPHALYKLALLEIRGGSKVRAKTLLLKLRKEHPTSAPAKLVDAQLKYLKENP